MLRWRLRVTADSSSSGDDLRFREEPDEEEGDGWREKVDVPGIDEEGDLLVVVVVVVVVGGWGVLDVEGCSSGEELTVMRGCSWARKPSPTSS